MTATYLPADLPPKFNFMLAWPIWTYPTMTQGYSFDVSTLPEYITVRHWDRGSLNPLEPDHRSV